jgi:hypothetical protein
VHTQFEQDGETVRAEALPGVVDLHRQVRGVVAAVVVVSRLASLTMVALSVVAAAHNNAYTNVALATAVYVVVAGWSAVLITLVVRRAAEPGWVLVVDVTITVVTMIVLPLAVSTPLFINLANPYLEPITVSVAVTVAMISGSTRNTVAGNL